MQIGINVGICVAATGSDEQTSLKTKMYIRTFISILNPLKMFLVLSFLFRSRLRYKFQKFPVDGDQ